MPERLERFLTAAASDAHAVVYQWLSPKRVSANRRAELEPVHARAAAALAANAPAAAPAAGDSEGAPCLIELSGDYSGHAIIAVPRVRQLASSWGAGGAVTIETRRYVAVDHRTFALESPALLRALLATLRAAFPGYDEARIYRRSGGATDLESVAADAGVAPGGLIHSRRLLAAPVAAIQALPIPERFDRVAAVRVHNLDFYETYAFHYRRMLADRPDLAPEIPIESRDEMASYLAEGLLFHILIEDHPGGVMAARRTCFAGIHGFQIHEKFIYPAFRGKGYAAAVQRRFIQTLDPSDNAILSGFIHPRNVWSLRAAAHDTRIDVGGYTFLAL